MIGALPAVAPFWWRRTCPLCERRVRRFTPLPEAYERQARQHGYAHFGRGETINVAEYSCPHCGASDRERLYALYLKERLARGIAPGTTLLHFAPEGALSSWIRRNGAFRYRTADLAMTGVDDCIDITAMAPYRDHSFDAFICSHVLEHVPDDAAALRELHRILRPGGWGILMVPVMTNFDGSVEDPGATSESDRWRLFGQGDHVRLYAKRDFLQRVARAGFTTHAYGGEHFGLPTFRKHGITPRSMLYVVSHD